MSGRRSAVSTGVLGSTDGVGHRVLRPEKLVGFSLGDGPYLELQVIPIQHGVADCPANTTPIDARAADGVDKWLR